MVGLSNVLGSHTINIKSLSWNSLLNCIKHEFGQKASMQLLVQINLFNKERIQKFYKDRDALKDLKVQWGHRQTNSSTTSEQFQNSTLPGNTHYERQKSVHLHMLIDNKAREIIKTITAKIIIAKGIYKELVQKCFTCIDSFHSYINSMWEVPLFSPHDRHREVTFPQVSQLISDRVGWGLNSSSLMLEISTI